MTDPIVNPAQQISIEIANQQLVLRGDGTIWIPQQNALLVADLHLGKDASFRAAGIPVPAGINQSTLDQLSAAIAATDATRLMILGDLIHNRDSMSEAVVAQFAMWRERHSLLEVRLALGNHDRHARAFPESWNLQVSQTILLDGMVLCHQVAAETDTHQSAIQIGGHWHPIVRFGNRAEQIRMPCFVVDPQQITLPAFGPFKGGLLQKKVGGRKFYPIRGGQIWSLA